MRVAYAQRFEVNADTEKTINLAEPGVTMPGNGEITIDELYIQVEGACSIEVTGRVKETADYSALTAIDMSTLESAAPIAAPGIYTVPTAGLSSAKLNITGITEAVNITVKLIY